MFHIQRKSGVPLTEQICQEYADRIRSGIIEPDSRLPSVRELAEALHVSLVTVVHAYRLLVQQGLAKTIHGKGTFAHDGGKRAAGNLQVGGHTFDWQVAITDYLPRAAVWGVHGSTSETSRVPYKMSTASLEPKLSTVTLPSNFYSVLQEAPYALSEYGPVEGMEVLRRGIGGCLREHFAAETEDILITNGVQQAIDMAARTFIGPGDVVVVEAPTYSGAIDVFRARGAVLVSIPMDDEGIRLDLLMKQCDKVPPKLIYTMPTFQNPTGIVMSARRRRQLLDLAESYQSLILEDDSFSDCSFIGTPPPPIRSLDKYGHVIYAKGFSKVFCSGCRIAAIVSSGSVRNRLMAAKSVSDLGSPIVNQLLLQACMTQPNKRQRIEKIAQAVQGKRDIALEVLAEQSPVGVSWTVPSGGYNIWLTLPAYVNTDALLIQALRHGVSFLPGSACYANDALHHQLRMSVALLDADALREGVARLCTLLSGALNGKSNSHLPLV